MKYTTVSEHFPSYTNEVNLYNINRYQMYYNSNDNYPLGGVIVNIENIFSVRQLECKLISADCLVLEIRKKLV